MNDSRFRKEVFRQLRHTLRVATPGDWICSKLQVMERGVYLKKMRGGLQE
jgi:hypothetical protein